MADESSAQPQHMAWWDAVSALPDLEQAVAACAVHLQGIPHLDVLFCYAAPNYPDLDRLPAMLREHLSFDCLVGCCGGGIIGGGRELEQKPGLALLGGTLPNVQLRPFHLTAESLSHLDRGPSEWANLLEVPADARPGFVVMADPFTFPIDTLTRGLDYGFPGGRVVGGLASGGRVHGEHTLFLNDTVHREGAVGVALWGEITVDTIVSQGVRPVGPTLLITRADRQLIYEVDETPVLTAVESLFAEISDADRELAQRALFLGISQHAANDDPHHGDFLIRNVVGIVRDENALAIGDTVREGQLVRFHVRDATTAAEELDALLSDYAQTRSGPMAALLFSCLGRGRGLYGTDDHDSQALHGALGTLPMAGFFCNGEIGPVGPQTYLHGYTSAFGLFRRP